MENKTNLAIRQRMEDFQASPSEEIWENLEKNLSKKESRIYDFEVAPPEDCWENIVSSLYDAGQKRLSFLRLNNTQWLRYAAVFLGIITLTIFAFNTNIRNRFINGLNNSNINASLPEKSYHFNKNILNKDSSSTQKYLLAPLNNQSSQKK